MVNFVIEPSKTALLVTDMQNVFVEGSPVSAPEGPQVLDRLNRLAGLCHPHLNTCNDSWRVDETYIKIKKVWFYLYRAVDSQGETIEFFLSRSLHSRCSQGVGSPQSRL